MLQYLAGAHPENFFANIDRLIGNALETGTDDQQRDDHLHRPFSVPVRLQQVKPNLRADAVHLALQLDGLARQINVLIDK